MLIPLYESVLAAAGLVANKEGLISMDLDGIHAPCTVGKDPAKRLVLPIPEVLANPNWQSTIAFHPMAESLLRGESEVLRKLKGLLMVRVLSVTADLATQLMAIAVNVDAQKKLTPDQHEFLSTVGAVSENTFKDLTKIVESLGIDKNQLCNMYLKRAGQWKGKGYSRVAVTTFPLIEQLGSQGKEVFNFSLHSQKNKKAIKALFDYILPEADNVDKYSYGTNSDVAPYFHAMMSSFAKIAKQLNGVTRKFKKHLDEADKLLINLEFDKELNDLGKFRDLIPSLSGNEGVLLDKSGAETKPQQNGNKVVVLDTSVSKQAAHHALASIENAEVPLQQTQAPQQTLPWEAQQQAPQHQTGQWQPPQPQPTQAPRESGVISFDSLLQNRMGIQPPPVQQPMYQQPQQYMQQPMGQPVLTPQQMFVQQFQHPQQSMMGYPAQQPMYQQPMYPTGI